jgi:peptide/nickel transport system substrate-binding protein
MGTRRQTTEPTRRRGSRGFVAVCAALAVVAGSAWVATGPADAQSSGGGERTVRIPYDLAAFGGVKFDPTTVPSPADWYMQQWMYDSLLRQNADGSYSPGLAKSAKVVDPQTIEVELRPGQTFSDGTPLDAEAVKFSIERTKAANNVGAVRAELNQVSSITVDSPTKLTIKLATPVAGQFFNLLANGETYVVSPTAVQSGTSLDEKPVGAGPFTLESYTPEGSAVFVRNEDFIDNKKVKIDRVELVQVAADPTGQATVNALLDDIVDVNAMTLAPSQIAPLEQAGFTVDQARSDSAYYFGALCKNKPPFDNLKVRQALNYATDKDEINAVLYQGGSEPMQAHWTSGNELFNPKLDGYYDRNVKKAKKLLKEAGAENLEFDMFSNTSTDTERIGELLKQQWAEAGITVNLRNVTNIVEEFFTQVQAPAALIPLGRAGLDKVTRNLTPGSIGDICGYDDPKLNDYVAQLRQLDASSQEYVDVWHEMDQYIVENALELYLIWRPFINVYEKDTITKPVYRPDVFGAPRFDMFKTQVSSAS